MDECLEPSYCEHGRCENFLGGFNCSCDSGYIRSDDKKTCIGEWNFTLIKLFKNNASDNLF